MIEFETIDDVGRVDEVDKDGEPMNRVLDLKAKTRFYQIRGRHLWPSPGAEEREYLTIQLCACGRHFQVLASKLEPRMKQTDPPPNPHNLG